MTELIIKNMVCRHCIEALSGALQRLGLNAVSVELGRATVNEDLSEKQLADLDSELQTLGFSRINDRDDTLVEKIKHVILQHLRSEKECHLNLSACIEKETSVSYSVASRIFSRKEGRTIEKYRAALQIEYVKELLGYKEFNLSQIAHIAGFSSEAHLSRRFKEITGMTPTQYLRNDIKRTSLNQT